MRWQEYTEELDKSGLSDPENHDGVFTVLEQDMLECEVKWTLRSITTNKPSGGDTIPAELFQILKGDALKVLHSICQEIWKTAVVTWLEKVSCWGPAPVDPGNSKRGQHRRPGNNRLFKR